MRLPLPGRRLVADLSLLSIPLLLSGAALAGCGEPKAPPLSASSGPPSSSAPSSPAPSAAAAGDKHHDDEDEDEVTPAAKAAAAAHPSRGSQELPTGAIALEGLFGKTAKAAEFPKKTANDKDCYRAVNLTGKHAHDYDAIAGACGAPTGMNEYAKKFSGKLDAKHPRDAFTVKMLGGFCYRFYAIGDATLGNLEIRVQRGGGALLSVAQSKQAAPILDPDEPWCKKHDRDFTFIVETVGGQGEYVFGVWARPK